MSLHYSNIIYFVSFFLASISVFLLSSGESVILEWVICSHNSIVFSLQVIFDLNNTLFFCVVSFIAANVIYFSDIYIEDEVHIKRLTWLVIGFISSISMFIFIPNILITLLGWDSLGLVSLVLVSLYSSSSALSSGTLTVVTNRVGDAFIVVSLPIFINNYYHFMPISVMNCLFACLVVSAAAITNSAQVPFSSWLPAAMEAPTPVSALVHSSTLVAAGVYLVNRVYTFFEVVEGLNTLMLVVGATTSLIAGFAAVVESDLNNVVALSTLSQLGYMFISFGVGEPGLAFFHIVTHATFKSLMLICVGNMIHFHGHNQDSRQLGSLSNCMPFSCSGLATSVFSLCAVPYSSGFCSNDAILESFFSSPCSFPCLLAALVATLITWNYSFNVIYFTVIASAGSNPCSNSSEGSNVPVFILFCIAVFSGVVAVSFLGAWGLEGPNPALKLFGLSFFFVAAVHTLKSKSPLLKLNKNGFSNPNIMHAAKFVWTYKLANNFVFFASSICKSDQSWLEIGKVQVMPLTSLNNLSTPIAISLISVALISLLAVAF